MDFRDILHSLGKISEATEKTKTGLKHTAEPGGYGRKDDEDEEGNKVKADAPKKGRGRPKKDADASGEVKSYDSSGVGSVFGGGKAPKKPVGTLSKKHSLKEYFDQLDAALLEGETTEKPGGRVHKGTYGTSHEAGDEGVAKVDTQRGRGRPKKDSDETGEVKNYDFSAFGAKKGVKLPAWDKSKTTSHKIKEAEQIQIKPASQVPKVPGQTSQPAQQQQVAGQPQKNTQVIQQGNKTLGTVDNPQLAQQIKQSIGKGEMTLNPDEEMAEGVLDTVKNAVGLGKKPPATAAEKNAAFHAANKGKNMPSSGNALDDYDYFTGRDKTPGGMEEGILASVSDRMQTGQGGALNSVRNRMQQRGAGMPSVTKIGQGAQQRLSAMAGKPQGVAPKEVEEGRDEGKPGKNFAKIAKGAAERYGSKAAGERVAGAVRAKLMKQGKLEESLRLSESSDTLEHIIKKFKHEVKNFMKGDDLDNDLYEALFDYYSDAGEIPYGVAKARDGDPFEWVTQRFDQDVNDHVVDESGPARYEVPAFKRVNRPADFPAKDVPIGNTTTLPGGYKPPNTPKRVDPFAMEEGDMMDMQFESWDKQLNKLLTEGITVSSSKGQQGAPDSVSVTATDADSDHLLAALRNAGIGIFGDEQKSQGFGSSVTMHSAGGENQLGHGSQPEQSPMVVGDGDNMLSLIKKMTGIQDSGNPEGTVDSDYEDEEGEVDEGSDPQLDHYHELVAGGMDPDEAEEQAYQNEEEDEITDEGNAFSGAVAKAKSDNIPDKGQKFNVGGKSYPVKEEDEESLDDEEGEELEEGEEECNECGYTMESCDCDHEQVEENYANSAKDPAETEMMKLKALLSVGGDMHRQKRSQTVGNPTRVAFESQVNDWKKLSGIK